MTFSMDDWKSHYASYDAAALIAEIPNFDASISLNQMYAFQIRLLEVVTDERGLPYSERLKLADLAIATGKTLLRHERVEPALRKHLELQMTYGLYSGIAGAIQEGLFEEENVVGQILSTLTPVQTSLLAALVDRGGSHTVGGNRDHHLFDRLEELGLIRRTAVAMDAILYEITEKGRQTLASAT